MTNTPTQKDVDDLVYALRQKGNDDTYALVVAALAKWGAPQSVVQKPLTDEQMRAMRGKHPAEDLCGWSYRLGIADAEAHHGIKAKEAGNAE